MDSEAWKKIRLAAREQSLEEFSTEASNLIRLTKSEVEMVIPAGMDKEKLAELMEIVKDTTKDNNQKAEDIRSIAGLAEITVSLIERMF